MRRSCLAAMLLMALFAACVPAAPGIAPTAARDAIAWDRTTLTLIQPGGLYGRIIRLNDGTLFCAFERAGKSWACRSRDDGKTWQPPILVAQCPYGVAANPEVLTLRNGWLLFFYNERPRDGVHRFGIRLTVSRDGGATWTAQPPIYQADVTARNGCWEPAALQLPSGEVQLFFANNYPHKDTDAQEISLCLSEDNGRTWSAPRAVSFRAGHRDGMPVPLLLRGGRGIALAIEDNGLPGSHSLQPAIIVTSLRDNWRGPFADLDSPRRWGAVVPPLRPDVYAGAPYLCQLPDGTTLLSCQSTENHAKPRMVVYLGDDQARQFSSPSIPFDIPGDTAGSWNALFVKNADTVTALSSTTVHGVSGLWSIDGHVTRPQTTAPTALRSD